MELIKTALPRKRRTSEVLYFVINALLPTAVLLLVLNFNSPYVALALVALSKWRVFALQPRFWWANLRANLVDILVGGSVVALMFSANQAPNGLFIQILLAIGYTAWLLFLKPRSDANSIALQAGIAQFVSLTTIFTFSNQVPEPLVVLFVWLIAYVTARHFISNFDEPLVELLSLAWAFLAAELGWLLYHWTLVYPLDEALVIPQMAVLMLVISFTASRIYLLTRREDHSARSQTVRYTLLFGTALVAIILFTGKWNITI